MSQELIHKQICRNISKIKDWYQEQGECINFPIYSSFDIRDSGQKLSPVDANIFPAGFNNICDIDKENAPELFKSYLEDRYPELQKDLVLLTEEHTQNAYYWENVHTIKSLIEQAGYAVKVALPKEFDGCISVTSSGGHTLDVYSAKRVGGSISVVGQVPELIVNNNDFSTDYSKWVEGLDIRVNPHYKMGWHWRRKESFFNKYNSLVQEFSKFIDVPPILLQVKTESFVNFDINSESSRNDLAEKVDNFLESLSGEYKYSGIDFEPFAFIKNSSGTYGMGVTKVTSGDEVKGWNNKSRKKMKAAKGGGGFSEVIIQEGIPTKYNDESETAEPAIYLVGDRLAGGFLRTHSKKGPDDNLNSPGAVYKRLCISDLEIDSTKCSLENVYGWVAKICALSIAKEACEANIKF